MSVYRSHADPGTGEKGIVGRDEGVNPESVVWIFGSWRTGSSWLGFMMGDLPDHSRWNEPLVGYLFGHLYYDRAKHRTATRHFILGNEYKESWLGSIRSLVLEGATARFPHRARDGGYLVIKEPHGSLGAPLLMEALPESRMVFLIRDPRDVVSSALDAQRKGSRDVKERWGREPKQHALIEEDPDLVVRRRAQAYLRDISRTQQAYDSHDGYKVLVRYEDLRADTVGTMEQIYSTLGIPVDKEELIRAVEKRSWESIPEEEKGEGKLRRKASPGGWREDLTPSQVEIVKREAAPVLEQFYARE
jgi:hypothetical protein